MAPVAERAAAPTPNSPTVARLSTDGKAAKLVDELRARGFPAYTERAGNVTRVRVGPVAGRAQADAAAARLKSAGHPAVLQAR